MIFGAKINKNPFNHIIKRIFFHINGPSLSEDWLRENAVSLKKIMILCLFPYFCQIIKTKNKEQT
jgi:hypothetical protein